jgi:hypothetical protein
MKIDEKTGKKTFNSIGDSLGLYSDMEILLDGASFQEIDTDDMESVKKFRKYIEETDNCIYNMTDEEFRTDLKEILDGLANGDLW